MSNPDEQARTSPIDVSKTLEPTSSFGIRTSCSVLAEDKQHSGADVPQNEALQSESCTGANRLEVPSCDVNESLLSSCDNVDLCSLHEQAGLPIEAFEKTLKQINVVSFGTSYSQPTAKDQNLGSSILQDEPLQTISPVPNSGGDEQLQGVKGNTSVPSLVEQRGLSPEAVRKTFQTYKLPCSLSSQNYQVESSSAVLCSIGFEQKGLAEEMNNSVIGHLVPSPDDPSKDHNEELIKLHMNDANQNSCLEPSETVSKNAWENSTPLSCKDKQNLSSRRKSGSFVRSDRVLRSRTSDKPEAPELSNNGATPYISNNVDNLSNEKVGKRKKRKKKHRKRVAADEFSRIRSHLRYLLNRINYEISFIDAYSGEGWKGNSLEKLKPEKELQRATSEILRRKSKIRDLFQCLDSLCAEGMFPDSIFDEEGQIDSEDIFCAKCGSLDVYADNDIILCDGACNRGFHQHCLEPPLLSGKIPPDDEGWLCPGCDCKVDCIDLLNDSQGTSLSITDSWEKVFPEAAVVASAVQHQQNNQGLPSDDSDDTSYDPDGPETDEEIQESESSPDESEYASASDALETPKSNDEQYLGLPSDDSEDDDFNPDAPNPTEDISQGSLSSDFTSDSEDLAAVLDEDRKSSENDEGPQPSVLQASPLIRCSGGKGPKRGHKRHSIEDELTSVVMLDPGLDGSAPVSGKRLVERLDYKKLHDEEYGDISTSDDDDYIETAAPSKRKKGDGQATSRSLNGTTSIIKKGINTKDTKDGSDKYEHTPRTTPRRKSSVKDDGNPPNESLKSSPKSGSTGGRVKGSTYKRLGEAATQRLCTSFKENQYPDRSMKERLAEELGVLVEQVSRWFNNARHSVKVGVAVPLAMRTQPNGAETSTKDTDHSEAQKSESPGTADAVAGICSQDVKGCKATTLESSRAKTITPNYPKGRKRKPISDPGGLDKDEKFETPPEASIGGRVSRRRKSVS